MGGPETLETRRAALKEREDSLGLQMAATHMRIAEDYMAKAADRWRPPVSPVFDLEQVTLFLSIAAEHRALACLLADPPKERMPCSCDPLE